MDGDEKEGTGRPFLILFKKAFYFEIISTGQKSTIHGNLSFRFFRMLTFYHVCIFSL